MNVEHNHGKITRISQWEENSYNFSIFISVNGDRFGVVSEEYYLYDSSWKLYLPLLFYPWIWQCSLPGRKYTFLTRHHASDLENALDEMDLKCMQSKDKI